MRSRNCGKRIEKKIAINLRWRGFSVRSCQSLSMFGGPNSAIWGVQRWLSTSSREGDFANVAETKTWCLRIKGFHRDFYSSALGHQFRWKLSAGCWFQIYVYVPSGYPSHTASPERHRPMFPPEPWKLSRTTTQPCTSLAVGERRSFTTYHAWSTSWPCRGWHWGWHGCAVGRD